MGDMSELFGEPIHVYTRAQAIEDGVLVLVPMLVAREAGFTVPVAITFDAWQQTVEWNQEMDGKHRPVMQDTAGRLWDVLWMSRWAAKAATDSSRAAAQAEVCTVTVELHVVPPAPSKATSPRKTTLVMVIGPGDNAEPVITIMLPGEAHVPDAIPTTDQED